MRKLCRMILLTVLCMLLCAVCTGGGAYADGIQSGDYTYVVNADGTATIIKYDGIASNVIIPSRLDGRAVTCIGGYVDESHNSWWLAFGRNMALTSVTIPEGVKTIGYGAFNDCSNLAAVSLPSSLTLIEENAFSFCRSLLGIDVPDNVTIDYLAFTSTRVYASIGSTAAHCASTGYNNCFYVRGYDNVRLQYNEENGETFLDALPVSKSIETAALPLGVTRIGSGAFSDCDNLTSMEIVSSVRILKGNAFKDCDNLTSVSFQEGTTSIGVSAFESCDNLASVHLPSTLRELGNNVFWQCNNLVSPNIPYNLESVGTRAFGSTTRILYAEPDSPGAYALSKAYYSFFIEGYDNVRLQYAFSSGKVTYLDAFKKDSDISSAEIPPCATRIKNAGFMSCHQLNSITIPEGVTVVNSQAFESCDHLTEIHLPSTLTAIGSDIFSGCTSLAGADIPDNVSNVTSFAFSNWPGRAYASVGSPAAYAISDSLNYFYVKGYDNVKLRYSTGGTITPLCAYPYDQSIDSAEIPAGVDKVNSFTNCDNLISVTIPEGVTSITSFSGCDNLAEVSLPSTLTTISSNAFANCLSLQELDIPAGITLIGNNFFSGCVHLRSVQIPAGVTAIGDNAFKDCAMLEVPVLPEALESIGSYAFAGCDSFTAFSIPAAVTRIESGTFQNCAALAELSLPSNLAYIGAGAFDGCALLDSLDMPDSVSEIDAAAFDGCHARLYTGMDSVTAQSISRAGFRFCVNADDNVRLQYKYSQNEVTALEAWPENEEITSAVIPDGVTGLGEGAFSVCRDLLDVDIPDTLVSFPSEAFPMIGETLHVGCVSAARAWAEAHGYAAEGAEGTYHCVLKHGESEYAPAVPPTCTEVGLGEGLRCAVCHDSVGPREIIPALGHDWRAAGYTWAEDYSSLTAERSCRRDEAHIETETVPVSSTVISSPTETAAGSRLCSAAQFNNSAFTALSMLLNDVPALNTYSAGLVLPASLNSIEAEAFAGGTFQYVILPPTCTEIGEKAFADCTQLRYIHIPASAASIASDAFSGCGSNLIIDRLS